MFCTQCGNANDGAAKFCLSCGAAMQGVVHDATSMPSPSPAISRSGQSGNAIPEEEFYSAVIGPKNQDYYLRQFARFDEAGKPGITWHWPALFVTFYWLLYRKMWLNAFLYFVAPYAIMIPVGFVAAIAGIPGRGDSILAVGNLLFLGAVFLLPPLYANALYYRHCRKKIAEVRASSNDVQRQLGELTGKGGTSGVIIIFLLVFVFIAVLGILAAIAIPAYQDYTTRARTSEGATIGKSAADAIANYYHVHQMVPVTLGQAGYVPPASQAIRSVEVDADNGTVSVIMAKAPIEGKALLLTPSLDANNRIVWTCRSKEIADKFLPHDCRQKK
jgi:Tfp pilus assembly protein PilE